LTLKKRASSAGSSTKSKSSAIFKAITVTIAKFIFGTKLLNVKTKKVTDKMSAVKIIALPL